MQARMKSPVFVVPGAMDAMQALNHAIDKAGVSPTILGLVHMRASQINGCSVCLDMHPRLMKKAGETDERLHTIAGWRDAPYFDAAERAALALTESLTKIADRPEGVPDEIWAEAARHFDEQKLGAVVLSIAAINVWNRLNVATRQIAGAHKWA